MPSFMKDEMKKKDEEKLAQMQEEINEAAMAADDAEAETGETKPAAEEADNANAEVESLKAQLQEKADRVIRLQADFDNFRRRTRQEKEAVGAVVTQDLIKGLLPMLDDFERAMQSQDGDPDGFRKGMEMIYKKFRETLKNDGLEVIETEGKEFDPNFHQAVMRVNDPEKKDGTIAMELQKGYMVNGTVIRPSMVQVVSN